LGKYTNYFAEISSKGPQKNRENIARFFNEQVYCNDGTGKKVMPGDSGKKRQSQQQVAFAEPFEPTWLDLKGFCCLNCRELIINLKLEIKVFTYI